MKEVKNSIYFTLFSFIILAGLGTTIYYHNDPEGWAIGGDYDRDPEAHLEYHPYNESNSRVLESLMADDSNYYEFKSEWQPKIWRRQREGSQMIKLHPFPIVENVDEELLAYSRKDIESIQGSEHWESFGIRGVGVVVSIDYEAQNPNHLLMGTEASGVYHSYDQGASWEKLPFPRQDIHFVAISPNDSNHYIVYAKSRKRWTMPLLIYQSYDAGLSWDSGSSLYFEDGLIKDIDVYDMEVANSTLSVVASDQKLKKYQKNTFHILQQPIGYSKLGPFKLKQSFEATRHGRLKIHETGHGIFGVFDRIPGDYEYYRPRLYKTSDHGENWDLIFGKANNPLPFKMKCDAYDISSDGQIIYASFFTESHVFKYSTGKVFLKSVDGGKNWIVNETEKYSKNIYNYKEDFSHYGPMKIASQDIILNDKNSNYVGTFIYMHGFFESYDGGKTFSQNITQFKDMVYLDNAEGEVQAVVPQDLRVDGLKGIPVWNGMRILMPTDQGLFGLRMGEEFPEIDDTDHPIEIEDPERLGDLEEPIPDRAGIDEHRVDFPDTDLDESEPHSVEIEYAQSYPSILTNLAPTLYLGDSGQVTVTSCPRVYSGLWHVGSYWVNPDNSIEGFNAGENAGYGIGPDNGCQTPVFNLVHGYLGNGKVIDQAKTQWIKGNVKLGWPISETFRFYKDWWYQNRIWGWTHTSYMFNEVQKKFGTFKAVKQLALDYFDPHSDLWMYSTNYRLRRKNLSTKKNTLVIDFSAATSPTIDIAKTIQGLRVFASTVVLFGNDGMLFSNDAGMSWHYQFVGEPIWAVEFDKCGRLYIARQPDPQSGVGGVYRSEDLGQSFVKLGVGDEISHLSSLAIDYVNNILYAGTIGESLLRLSIDECQP